ncbi:MAG: DUF4340 domain-containing protein [Chloroflexi bacterium]|nr:DUF4340 domain-containing protein [Chloroflexota bacterium]
MNRTNQILAVVLAVQIVLVAVVFWPRPASVVSGESLLAGLGAEQITRLTISDATGKYIELAKGAGGWVLPEAGDYPCLENKVPPFLEKIVALKANRLVTQTPASHKRLKVADDDFDRRIELNLADGTTHRLYLGTSPSYGTLHVRVNDQPEVYLASLSASDAGIFASNWIDTLYFSVAQDQIVALTVENGNGRFEFEKDDAGTWAMKGLAADETLNQNNVTSLATRLSSLRMLRPLGKTEQDEYGLKEPNAVVTVETRDDEGNTRTHTIRVGAKDDEDNSVVVISSESPYYVRVSEYTVKDFVEKARDDFLELPPTPTPEPTS